MTDREERLNHLATLERGWYGGISLEWYTHEPGAKENVSHSIELFGWKSS